jgi:transcriptional regulator with XRE-family HTH domain
MPHMEGAMTDELSPTLRRIDLGRALRAIRDSQGKTIEQVSADLSAMYSTGFSAAKISRIETAKRGINPRDVRDLCDYYDVAPDEKERLINLAKEAQADNHLQGVSDALAEYVALEKQARLVRIYEPMFVPGILQTADYQKASFDSYASAGIGPDSSSSYAKMMIRIRSERARLLSGPNPLNVFAIIDENVVRRCVGSPQVMARQLAHLIDVSAYSNITLRVISAACGLYPGSESAGMSLLEFGENESSHDEVCLLDGLVGSVWVERAADRTNITRILECLEGLALGVEESREIILAAARGFE